MEAHKINDGTIGARAHRRLRANENYDDLILLSDCDRGGRQVGVRVAEVDEALDYIRDVAGNVRRLFSGNVACLPAAS